MGYSRFVCERELETEQKLQYFDLHSYGRQRCVFLVLQMLNRRPRGLICWVMAFFTASYQHLLWTPNSIGVPEGPLGRVWLSLPLLVQLRTPTLLELLLELSWLLSWLSYIIVQRPLDRPLDLWNCMFHRHPAEITVMQFRGHSLPVRLSMRVSWDFLACPILLANFRPRNFFSQLPLECVTSFRCITLNGILGRVEGQNITNAPSLLCRWMNTRTRGLHKNSKQIRITAASNSMGKINSEKEKKKKKKQGNINNRVETWRRNCLWEDLDVAKNAKL